MPESFSNIVVLGIGNLLRCDEGLGVQVIQRLIADGNLPDHVRLIDGGVMGLDLLPCLEGCQALLIVDAVDARQPPGSVIRLDGELQDPQWQQKFSMHQAGVFDLLSILQLRGMLPPRVVVWGIQPASLEWSIHLSEPVAAALPELLAGIDNELNQWGVAR
jgi:hydrogenase maturation protease